MVINGVSFNDEACLGMGRKAFVKAHEGSFFLDRDIGDRRKILGDAYDIMEGNHGDDSGSGERREDAGKEFLAGGHEQPERERGIDP